MIGGGFCRVRFPPPDTTGYSRNGIMAEKVTKNETSKFLPELVHVQSN